MRAEVVALITTLRNEGRVDEAKTLVQVLQEIVRRDRDKLDMLRTLERDLFLEVRLFREDAEDLKNWFDKQIAKLTHDAEEADHAGLHDQDAQ